MQRAGLGRHKIIFEDKRGDHVPVRETLEKNFPKLALQNGAFQLLRCLSGGSGVQELSAVPMGVDGYPVSLLKEVCRSSTIYIRPMERDLSLEDALQNDHQQNNMHAKATAKAKCLNCNGEMELSTFTDHNVTCCKMYDTNNNCT